MKLSETTTCLSCGDVCKIERMGEKLSTLNNHEMWDVMCPNCDCNTYLFFDIKKRYGRIYVSQW